MIKSVQSLRFLFILLVVLSHIYGQPFDFGGECGVSFFFVLSGFILSYAYGKKVTEGTFRTVPFLKKRLTKLYPLHLLTFLIMVVLDARLGRFLEWYRLLANVLLLQSWIPDDSFFFAANGSSWFLSDLLFFYFVFAAMFKLLTSLPLHRLAMLMVAVLAVYMVLAMSIPLWKVNDVLYASPLTRLIDFCLGILCFRLYASQGQRGDCNAGKRCPLWWRFRPWLQSLSPMALTAIELSLVVVVVLSFFVYEEMTLRLRCAALFWLYLPLFLYVYVEADRLKGAVTKLLHLPFMQWLGNISFELYLTHGVVLRLLWSVMLSRGYGEETHTVLPVVIFTVVLTIVVAWVTKRCFVDPVGRWLRSL